MATAPDQRAFGTVVRFCILAGGKVIGNGEGAAEDYVAVIQSNFMAIEATLETPVVIARLIHLDLAESVDVVLPGTDAHWLYQFLTPKLSNSRFCFPESWDPQRFEPIGDVFHVPPEQTLHARSDGGRLEAIVCQLRSDAMQRWFETNVEWSEQQLAAGLNIRNKKVSSLLLRLEEEARHPGFASEAMADLLAGQLAIELAHYYKAALNDRTNTSGLAPWRLRRIDERIADFAKAPTLAELAEICSISIRQLSRSFRVSQGCSIGDYIVNQRIVKARELLERGDSVKSVSYFMGFASPSAFGYAFRKVTGESPGEYRKRRH